MPKVCKFQFENWFSCLNTLAIRIKKPVYLALTFLIFLSRMSFELRQGKFKFSLTSYMSNPNTFLNQRSFYIKLTSIVGVDCPLDPYSPWESTSIMDGQNSSPHLQVVNRDLNLISSLFFARSLVKEWVTKSQPCIRLHRVKDMSSKKFSSRPNRWLLR